MAVQRDRSLLLGLRSVYRRATDVVPVRIRDYVPQRIPAPSAPSSSTDMEFRPRFVPTTQPTCPTGVCKLLGNSCLRESDSDPPVSLTAQLSTTIPQGMDVAAHDKQENSPHALPVGSFGQEHHRLVIDYRDEIIRNMGDYPIGGAQSDVFVSHVHGFGKLAVKRMRLNGNTESMDKAKQVRKQLLSLTRSPLNGLNLSLRPIRSYERKRIFGERRRIRMYSRFLACLIRVVGCTVLVRGNQMALYLNMQSFSPLAHDSSL